MTSAVKLKAGMRLRSVTCATEVVVVRPPKADLEVWCGGLPMVATDKAAGQPVGQPASDCASGTLLGKRYVDDAETLELLCIKAGDGTLSVGKAPLRTKEARKLPASD